MTQLSNAASIPDQTPAAGFVLAGKYRLTEMLGQGGMGTVYAAEQIELAVPVAIKLMHQHVAAHAEYVERFRREARAAMLLNHPNVVRVIDFGQHDKTFFIVMELIEGEPLDQLDLRASGTAAAARKSFPSCATCSTRWRPRTRSESCTGI